MDNYFPDSNTSDNGVFVDDHCQTSQPPFVSSSPIYPVRLARNEIRLIALDAPPRQEDTTNDPIHIHLETYPRHRTPEYDAVSYSWGGDSGDYTRNSPVYVGPWWDVLGKHGTAGKSCAGCGRNGVERGLFGLMLSASTRRMWRSATPRLV